MAKKKAHNTTPEREKINETVRAITELRYKRVCNYANKRGMTYHKAIEHWAMIERLQGREKMLDHIDATVDEQYKITAHEREHQELQSA
ncbi:MAG: hypothetical protein ACEQSL_03740 [Sediminibacterium sp.]